MQSHQLSVQKAKSSKRIGRGGKKGTYSGKGMKGQRSRSGFSSRATFEGGMSTLIARTKKLRGRGFQSLKEKAQVVKVSALEKKFSAGETVTLQQLALVGLIRSALKPVKIVSDGSINKALTIDQIPVTAAAKAKIEAAGGTVNALSKD